MTDDEPTRPPAFARSSPAGDWIASRHDDVRAVLADDRFGVPEAGPPGPVGTISWLRASVSRFVNGAEHQRRRACAVAELRPLHPHQLRRAAHRRTSTAIRQAARPGDRLDVMALLARRVPMAAMASALGIASAGDAADAVIRIAAGYFPGSDAAAQHLADTATAQLITMLGLDDTALAPSPPLRHTVPQPDRAPKADSHAVAGSQGAASADPVVVSTSRAAAQAGRAGRVGRAATAAAQASPDEAGLIGVDEGGLVGVDEGGLVGVDEGGLVGVDEAGLVGGDEAAPVGLDVIVARIALMVQGCDATAGLIGTALHFLQEAGDQVADWPISAVLDEVLRHRPVVAASGRIAREPVSVRGRQVRPGDRIRCDIEAASTDPTAIPSPVSPLTPHHPATAANRPSSTADLSHPAVGLGHPVTTGPNQPTATATRSSSNHSSAGTDCPAAATGHHLAAGRVVAAGHPAGASEPGWPGSAEAGPASLTFGYGVRPCPGRPQALALAIGVIEAVRDDCAFLPGQRVEYEPDQPLRVPLRLEVTLR